MNADEYYERHPSIEQRVGDIWTDVPTFGMLPFDRVSAVVITPACDLENQKTASITYLPIVPVRWAFLLPPLIAEFVRSLNGQLERLGHKQLQIPISGQRLPAKENCGPIKELLSKVEIAKGFGDKERDAVNRARACVSLIETAHALAFESVSLEGISAALGQSTYRPLLERIITNAARPDLHFLPDDRQRREWSGINEHSVALLRYPLSAPFEIFELAQSAPEKEWAPRLMQCAYLGSGMIHFSRALPVKKLTMRPRYIADLITRYIGMHVRLGSPDFPDDVVNGYVKEMKGGN